MCASDRIKLLTDRIFFQTFFISYLYNTRKSISKFENSDNRVVIKTKNTRVSKKNCLQLLIVMRDPQKP